MKKKCLYITATLMSVFITGCYPTGKKNESDIPDYINSYALTSESTSLDDTTVSANEPESNWLKTKNVIVSCDLPSNNSDTIDTFSSKMKVWDEEAIKALFFDEGSDLEYREFENRYNTILCHCYKTADNRFLSVDPGFLYYLNIDKNKAFSYSLISSGVFSTQMNEKFSSVEFDDFPLDKALSTVGNNLEVIGVTNYSQPIVYSITANDANAYFDSLGDIRDKNGNPLARWTDEQQCYILIYPLIYNDIELPAERENYISAIVTKNDLIEFSCYNVFSLPVENRSTVKIKYDSKSALNMVIDKYERIIIDEPVHIIDCKLTYVPKEQINETTKKYSPAWKFILNTKSNDIGYTTQIFVDVESGDFY